MGRCQCGAVYAVDPTGYNIGAAMVECLVYACGDWDLAWELLPEEDYLTSRLERYDEQTHQVVETGNLDGRVIKGVIYFVRLHKDTDEVAQRVKLHKGTVAAGKISLAQTASVPLEPERDPKRVRLRADKKIVRQLVEDRNLDALVDLCFDDKRTMSFMQRLLYDPDEAKRWAVAHVMGRVYARISTRQPGVISDILHRMFEACADSASVNWGTVEAIGEILAARPDIYGSFGRHLLSFIMDPSMQLQVVWALGTIAKSRPDLIRSMPFYPLFEFLDSPDDGVRGQTVRLLGRIKAREVVGRLENMQDDATPVLIYEEGRPLHTDIGELARQALALITEQGEGSE